MLRWYDYLAAVFISDILISIIFVGLASPVWWMQLLFFICSWFVLETWDLYCIIRREYESKN